MIDDFYNRKWVLLVMVDTAFLTIRYKIILSNNLPILFMIKIARCEIKDCKFTFIKYSFQI